VTAGAPEGHGWVRSPSGDIPGGEHWRCPLCGMTTHVPTGSGEPTTWRWDELDCERRRISTALEVMET
jgi:hypothetical protein